MAGKPVSIFFILFMVLASLIIGAIGSYLWLYYHSGEYLFDYSDTIDVVRMSSARAGEIHEWYLQDPEIEKVLCLNGYRNDDVVTITSYYEPETVESTPDSVLYVSCTGLNIIGTIHRQPEGICELSREDTYAFGKTNDLVMGVVCGPNMFRFYTPQDLNFGFAPEIT